MLDRKILGHKPPWTDDGSVLERGAILMIIFWKLHQILKWSCWNHRLNWRGMTH